MLIYDKAMGKSARKFSKAEALCQRRPAQSGEDRNEEAQDHVGICHTGYPADVFKAGRTLGQITANSTRHF